MGCIVEIIKSPLTTMLIKYQKLLTNRNCLNFLMFLHRGIALTFDWGANCLSWIVLENLIKFSPNFCAKYDIKQVHTDTYYKTIYASVRSEHSSCTVFQGYHSFIQKEDHKTHESSAMNETSAKLLRSNGNSYTF